MSETGAINPDGCIVSQNKSNWCLVLGRIKRARVNGFY